MDEVASERENLERKQQKNSEEKAWQRTDRNYLERPGFNGSFEISKNVETCHHHHLLVAMASCQPRISEGRMNGQSTR